MNNLLIVKERIKQIAESLGRSLEEITFVAVTKMRSIDQILELYDQGMRDFGENKVQELLDKKQKLPQDIRWHFIGRIQANKISKLIGQCHLIHSVADVDTAERISHLSIKHNLVTPILLQANTSHEVTKSGLSAEEWKKHFSQVLLMKGIQIKGLMTMAPLIEEEDKIRCCFHNLYELKKDLEQYAALPILSMGMSHDFPIALREGANCLRIGTALWN